MSDGNSRCSSGCGIVTDGPPTFDPSPSVSVTDCIEKLTLPADTNRLKFVSNAGTNAHDVVVTGLITSTDGEIATPNAAAGTNTLYAVPFPPSTSQDASASDAATTIRILLIAAPSTSRLDR